MPNDERILETMPTGTLGLIPTASCMELGKKVDSYLSTWREHREHEHHNDIAFKEYHKESYIIEPHIPRFGSGEAKCVINQSVRGYDLYIMVDVTNYSMTYSLSLLRSAEKPAVSLSFFHSCTKAVSTEELPVNLLTAH